MPNLSSYGRAVAVVALSTSVITGVLSVPSASAQSGSRLCGVLLTKEKPSASGSSYWLYLVEANKDSKGWGEFTKGFQDCENVQKRGTEDYRNEKVYDYAKCEEVSDYIGWLRYAGKPSGYNSKDICTSMNRGWRYRLGLSGESGTALNVESFVVDKK